MTSENKRYRAATGLDVEKDLLTGDNDGTGIFTTPQVPKGGSQLCGRALAGVAQALRTRHVQARYQVNRALLTSIETIVWSRIGRLSASLR